MKKILVSLLSIILVFGLIGCTSEESAEQAVKNTLDAVKSSNIKKASKYINFKELINVGEMNNDESNKMTKLILKNLDYKIISSTENVETATVTTEITNVDMSNILADYMQQAFALAFSGLDEKQLSKKSMEIFAELLNNKDNKTVTTIVDIQLVKKEEGWKVDLSKDLINAIMGGMISATESMNHSDTVHKLQDISNWVIGNVWNNGFVNVLSYISNGTNSMGGTLDIDFTIEQLKTTMEKKAEHDIFINGLEDEKYSNIKNIWSKLSDETELLYNKIKDTTITQDADIDFDTGQFKQYRDAFSDAVFELD